MPLGFLVCLELISVRVAISFSPSPLGQTSHVPQPHYLLSPSVSLSLCLLGVTARERCGQFFKMKLSPCQWKHENAALPEPLPFLTVPDWVFMLESHCKFTCRVIEQISPLILPGLEWPFSSCLCHRADNGRTWPSLMQAGLVSLAILPPQGHRHTTLSLHSLVASLPLPMPTTLLRWGRTFSPQMFQLSTLALFVHWLVSLQNQHIKVLVPSVTYLKTRLLGGNKGYMRS